jgi:hypothetical protein
VYVDGIVTSKLIVLFDAVTVPIDCKIGPIGLPIATNCAKTSEGNSSEIVKVSFKAPAVKKHFLLSYSTL